MTLRAAGFVIFRQITSEIEYLIMQASYGEQHWSPPKGHVDPGESSEETAVRETQEEAGISAEHLIIHYDFKRTLNYIAHNKPKNVTYWLAELRDPHTPIVLSEEHRDFKWLKVEEACKYVVFPQLQDVIRDAEVYVRSRLHKVL